MGNHPRREALRQPAVLFDVFGRGLREAYHTDDYPFVEVTAEFADGSSIVFCSSSQNYLLMPWKDKHGGQTFNRDIPRRLAALLPDVSVNKTRLFERLEEPDATSLLSAGLAPDLARRRGDSKVVGKTRQQFLDDMRRMGLLSDLLTHPRLVDGAVLVRQGRSPIHWMLMPDKRAVVWKEFMVDVPADGHPCPMVPVEGADNLDDLDMPSNCIGRVYAADGSVH